MGSVVTGEKLATTPLAPLTPTYGPLCDNPVITVEGIETRYGEWEEMKQFVISCVRAQASPGSPPLFYLYLGIKARAKEHSTGTVTAMDCDDQQLLRSICHTYYTISHALVK